LTLGLAVACGRTETRSQVSSDGSMPNGGSGSDVCLLIGCGEGFVSQPGPEGGCPICVLACDDVVCTATDCETGWHWEMRDDECCSVCVRNDAPTCEETQLLYQELRAQWFATFEGHSCLHEQDCGLLAEFNRCSTSCGVPLGIDAIAQLGPTLSMFAEVTCTSCPAPVAPPCPEPPALTCVGGNCQYSELLPK
jgi:hypothetical protein